MRFSVTVLYLDDTTEEFVFTATELAAGLDVKDVMTITIKRF